MRIGVELTILFEHWLDRGLSALQLRKITIEELIEAGSTHRTELETSQFGGVFSGSLSQKLSGAADFDAMLVHADKAIEDTSLGISIHSAVD